MNRYNILRIVLWSLIMILLGSIITKVMYNRHERERVLAGGQAGTKSGWCWIR